MSDWSGPPGLGIPVCSGRLCLFGRAKQRRDAFGIAAVVEPNLHQPSDVLHPIFRDGGRLPYPISCVSLYRGGKAVTDTTTQGSEQMSLVQLIVPTEVAHDTIAELGELGNVEFKDVSGIFATPLQCTGFSTIIGFHAALRIQLNPTVNPFQRSFVGEVRRTDEMARRVRFFASQIEKEKDPINIRPLYDSAPLVTVGPRAAQTIDELDVKLEEHEARLTQMNESYQLLSERLRELVEARHVLRETAVFFEKVSWVCHRLRDACSRYTRRPLSARARRASLWTTVRHPFCSTMIGSTNTLRSEISNWTSSEFFISSHALRDFGVWSDGILLLPLHTRST